MPSVVAIAVKKLMAIWRMVFQVSAFILLILIQFLKVKLNILLQFVVSVAVLSSVALIVAAWGGIGALVGAATLLGVAAWSVVAWRSAAAWVRATAIWTVVRSSWSVEIHVGFASFDGLDDCSLSAAAGYEVELGIGKEVLELSAWLPKNLYISDVLSGELVGILAWLIRDLAWLISRRLLFTERMVML